MDPSLALVVFVDWVSMGYGDNLVIQSVGADPGQNHTLSFDGYIDVDWTQTVDKVFLSAGLLVEFRASYQEYYTRGFALEIAGYDIAGAYPCNSYELCSYHN